MKSIFRRHSLITNAISNEIYSKHKEKFIERFGNHIPTYAEVFDWFNDACGIAIFINIVGHIEWDNTRRDGLKSTTSIPQYQSFAFEYGELCSCPDIFTDDWDGCADNAIDIMLSKIYGEDGVWFGEFTDAYDGSCDRYHSISEYIEDNE